MLIDLLDDALDSGRITDQQYRDNLKITFITGHENVQLLLNSLFWELGRNQVRTPLTHMTTPNHFETNELTTGTATGSSTQTQRRSISNKCHHPNSRHSQKALIPLFRHPRAPPSLPAHLPTHQPHHDQRHRARRRHRRPSVYVSRMELLRRPYQPAGLGSLGSRIPPSTVGQDGGGNPIEIPSGLCQGRVHPV